MANPLEFTQSATVLVVDDGIDNLALITSLLKGPYKVQVAKTGEKAIEIAQSERPPDIILLDIMMAGRSGYEICKILKAHNTSRDIPIIFLTAMTAAVDEKAGLELGAVDFITKPVDPEILRTRVAKQLRSKAAADFLAKGIVGLDLEVTNRTEVAKYAHPAKISQFGFQSFAQADRPTMRQKEGTELGMADSMRFGESMGGQFGVSSFSARSSTFSITSRDVVAEASTGRLSPEILPLQGKRALIVDDNPSAAMALVSLLQDLGFHVQIASSGEMALRLILAARSGHSTHDDQSAQEGIGAQPDLTPFDFVLIDWLMASNNCLETIQAIKALPDLRPAVIFMVADNRRQELLQSAEKLDVEHVLSKPVNSYTLADTMMQASGIQMPLGRVGKSDEREPEKNHAQLKQFAGSSILLVEDNELNQQVAYELLCDAGFVVDIAADGQKAVSSVEARASVNRPYDLVLMDMQMPVMDGITATREIRRNHSPEQLTIIAMTSNALQADRERCLTAGMDDFVTKPIVPDLLWKTLLRWIKPRPGIGQTNAGTKSPAHDDTKIGANTLKLPEHIKGLDLRRGLMFMDDHEGRYLQALGIFIDTQAQLVSRIRLSLERADLAEAERQAHTVKGQSGYLGAQDLQKAAGDLEVLLNEAQKSTSNQNIRPDDIERALQEVAKHLDTILQSVGQAFPQGLAPDKTQARELSGPP